MHHHEHHDAKPGYLRRCQICNSENLADVIDLGHQPLCDSLLSKDELNGPEKTFPLRLLRCKDCSLTQLDYVVPGDEVYHREYPYRAGITAEVVEHHQGLAASQVSKHQLSRDSLIVDIGCNDGTLLKAFKKHGMRTVGVEPTNIAHIARAEGIDVVQSPFTVEVARQIKETHGQASVLTATNVFAHMASLGEVMRAAETLLKDGGLFVTESHYLTHILQKAQYDSIYHEHIRSYTMKSLVKLFAMYDFSILDAEVVERYSGTVRVTAVKGTRVSSFDSVTKLLAQEEKDGIYRPEIYQRFRNQVYQSKYQLLDLAMKAKDQGKRFVGNSCPGRCSTLVNFVGLSTDLMPYIAEQPTSLKLGLHLPGKHTPVVDNEILFREQPDYVLLLAWHYAPSISALLRQRGLNSQLIVPLPAVQVVPYAGAKAA